MKPYNADEVELERVKAARAYVHVAVCPRGDLPGPCVACPTVTGTLHALRLLDQRPRDARGARRALHDAVCDAGCRTDSDHADRTQSSVAASLRKFRGQEVDLPADGGAQ